MRTRAPTRSHMRFALLLVLGGDRVHLGEGGGDGAEDDGASKEAEDHDEERKGRLQLRLILTGTISRTLQLHGA
eukprot:4440210-Pleurochrysis_carterae.AAC.1